MVEEYGYTDVHIYKDISGKNRFISAKNDG